MATFTLQANFGASYNNADTINLFVNFGTIAPTSTTKGDLAGGISVTCSTGATITAILNSGTCNGTSDTVTAQFNTPTPTPAVPTATPTPTPTPTSTAITPTPTPSAISGLYGTSVASSGQQVCNYSNTPNLYHSPQFIDINNISTGDRIYTDSGYTNELASGYYGLNNRITQPTPPVIWILYTQGTGVISTDVCGTHPTPTPTPAFFNFGITAYDSQISNVCNAPLSQSVWTNEFTSWADISSGDRVYSDASLTTEIYGGNNYYGMNDGQSGNATLWFRYSTGYGIDFWGSCPTPTPTPATPTPTPTPTAPILSQAYVNYSAGSGTVSADCSTQTSNSNIMYFKTNYPYSNIQIGDIAYRENTGTLPWIGAGEWYGISGSPLQTPGYSLEINTSGIITDIVDCNAITPTPTPTPTPTAAAVRIGVNAETYGTSKTYIFYNANDACRNNVTRKTVYYGLFSSGKNASQLQVGDRVYTDGTLSVPITGGNTWYGISDTEFITPIDTGDPSIQIDNNGYVTQKVTCSGWTPTPTPTGSPTPTPTVYSYYINTTGWAWTYGCGYSSAPNTLVYSTRANIADITYNDILYTDSALTTPFTNPEINAREYMINTSQSVIGAWVVRYATGNGNEYIYEVLEC